MSDNFNLSKLIDKNNRIDAEYVSEFIKLIKANLCNFNKRDYDINIAIINRFAGEKL